MMGKTRMPVISPAHMSVKIEDSRGEKIFQLRGKPEVVFPSFVLFCETKLDLGPNTALFDTWVKQLEARLKKDFKELMAYEI